MGYIVSTGATESHLQCDSWQCQWTKGWGRQKRRPEWTGDTTEQGVDGVGGHKQCQEVAESSWLGVVGWCRRFCVKLGSLYKLILNYRKVEFFLGLRNFPLEQSEGTFWLKVFYAPNFS